jgi:hypothetical protein
LNSFRGLDFAAADWQTVRVREKQAHRLHVAGIAQFAQFLGKPPTINRLA